MIATFFGIVAKLVNKQSSIYHLNMFSTFFTFTAYTNVINTVVFMVGNRKKKTIYQKPTLPLPGY